VQNFRSGKDSQHGVDADEFGLLAGSCLGQAPAVPPEDLLRAPVVLDGERLFVVRGFDSLPAGKRASDIAGRIRALAGDRRYAPGTLQILEQEGLSVIRSGDKAIVSLTDMDSDSYGASRALVAKVAVTRIDAAIQSYRAARSSEALLRGAGPTLAVTAGLLAALFLLRWIFLRLDAALHRYSRARLEVVRVQALSLVETERLLNLLHTSLQAIRIAIVILACYFYLGFVFGLFPWTRMLSLNMAGLILDPLQKMGSEVVASLPSLAFLAVLFVVVRYLLKLIKLLFAAVERGTIGFSGFDPEWAGPTLRIARILIVAFSLVVAYPYLPGSGSEAFKGVSLFIGVIFSLGSTGVISNITAGYSLTYRRAYRVGDRIEIGGVVGDVEHIRLQVTHLRSLKNEEIIIPNSAVLNSNVRNFSSLAKQRGLILHTTVGIGYETPWRQVEAMLLLAAERTKDLLRQPPPFVLQQSLGDFCITYELNVYCDQPKEQMRLYTELHRHILDIFNEYGVQIMTPAYEGDPEVAKVVPKSKWFERPAMPAASGSGESS
jgi:small-conductance mechanosensitive channel